MNQDNEEKEKINEEQEVINEEKRPKTRGRKPKLENEKVNEEVKEETTKTIKEDVESKKVYEDIPYKPLVKEDKKKHNSYAPLWYILVFFLGVIFTVSGIYVFKDKLFYVPSNNGNGACYTSCQNKVTITETGISDSVDKIYDAVVLVQNYVNDRLYSTGTGFVYKVDSKYGYLMTNYHVIKNNTSIKVVMSNDEVVDAEYVGGDQYIDIAVLRINKDKVIKVAELGDSTNSKRGDTVFAVGTPVDYQFRGTVTRGILSGKDRLVTVELDTNDNYVMKVLQTDAAINPGNSGGPLVNSNGEVIGITSSKLVTTEIEGMGFAIPIEDVKDKLIVFEKGEDIKRPFLGISMINVTETYSLYRYGIMLDDSITSGVVVVAVQNGSSSDGILQKGDVITKVDGNAVSSDAYLKYELFKHEAGDTLEITVIRGSKEQTLKIKLKEK